MENKLSELEKKAIIEKITQKGVKTHCPMCSNNSFTISDGYFNNTIQSNLKDGVILGGPSIPTIAIICNNCGFISQHALGVLGLLNK